jgi:hypothetical protein
MKRPASFFALTLFGAFSIGCDSGTSQAPANTNAANPPATTPKAPNPKIRVKKDMSTAKPFSPPKTRSDL